MEEERIAGWTPVAGTKGLEDTPTRYRHTISAPRGTTTKASFTTEHLDSEQIVLTELDVDDMLVRIRGLENESPALKAMVAKLTALVEDMNKAKTQRSQLDTERERIGRDQERVRDNLQSVGQGSDLGRRYLATLKTQEDRLAEIGNLDTEAREGDRREDEGCRGRGASADVVGHVIPGRARNARARNPGPYTPSLIDSGFRVRDFVAPRNDRIQDAALALISSTAASTRSGVVGASITGASL